MWGDEFAYWAEDRFAEIDNHIRELNQWWADHGLSWLRYMSLAGIVMGESNFPVPPFAVELWRLLVGENPRANEHDLRTLAEYWAEEARKTGDVALEAAEAARGVNVVWLGDGAPWVFQQEMARISLSLAGLARTQADLAVGAAKFTTEVVGAKAAFRAQVILLLFELVMAIATAVPSLGSSLAVAAARRAVAWAALKAAMRVFVSQLRSVVFRSSLHRGGRATVRLGSTLPRRSLPRLRGPARPPISPRPVRAVQSRVLGDEGTGGRSQRRRGDVDRHEGTQRTFGPQRVPQQAGLL